MNMARHREAHRKLYRHLARGEIAEAEKIKDFYDEYFAVLDLTEEFYLETIDRIFQKAELATGELHLPRPQGRSGRDPQHRAADRRGRARRHLRARPDRRRPRPLHGAAPAPEAPSPPGQRRPLRRLQRPPLGEGDLSGGAQHDPGDGIALSAAGWRRSGTRRCRRRRRSGSRPRRAPSSRRARGSRARPARAAATAAGSRTMPPLPTAAGPTSNCGLTSATSTAPGRASASAGGSALASEMNERSATIQSGAGTWPAVRSRTFSPSIACRRGSAASAGRELAVADVDRPDLGGAGASSTSLKPPVEAPRSSATAPAGSSPKASSAWTSFSARARDPGQRVAVERQRARPAATLAAAFAAGAPSTRTTPAAISACARARLGEAGGDQRLVEPHHRRRRKRRVGRRRWPALRPRRARGRSRGCGVAREEGCWGSA